MPEATIGSFKHLTYLQKFSAIHSLTYMMIGILLSYSSAIPQTRSSCSQAIILGLPCIKATFRAEEGSPSIKIGAQWV